MTVAVPVPSTSDAAWWAGCACSASGLTHGQVVGTDIDDAMLAVANEFVAEESLGNVKLVKDDLFATSPEPASFDLVHARYEITPLGRGPEQMTTYLQLVRPGGTVVLEDPDVASWHFNPPAPALEKLITLIVEAFRRTGVIGTPDAGGTGPLRYLRHRGKR